MVNEKTGQRELAYVSQVRDITPMNADKLECVHIDGWHCVCGKGEFKVGDIGVFFEIDSKLPEVEPFTSMEFLKSKKYKISTQKIRGEYSQGLFVSPSVFGWEVYTDGDGTKYIHIDKKSYGVGDFLTDKLGVTYAVKEDNERKGKVDPIRSMQDRHRKFFKKPIVKKMMKYKWFRKLMLLFLGRKKNNGEKKFPVGRFPGVTITDQSRIENLPWVLQDKTPFIRTMKCDGSSGTYILEKKHFGRYEFYVCSRRVRMLKPSQECFFGSDNYYWEVAKKYDIENKLKDYLTKNPDITWVCWQGEVCAPKIQGNPHGLTETHFFCFHMTDSKNGRFDIREAENIWKSYDMEVVPIDKDEYILPDDLEEFKLTADGLYDPSVCEGKTNQPREGFVYYKTTDPTFSFKNVSREYLLKHGG